MKPGSSTLFRMVLATVTLVVLCVSNSYAQSFGPNSDVITNKYVSKFSVGFREELIGYGSRLGEWDRIQVVGKTTYNGIKCLIIREDYSYGDYAVYYFAQDLNEDVRFLRVYGFLADEGETFDIDLSSSPVLVMPQNPYVGQSWTTVDGATNTVVSINENVNLLSTGLGPFPNCLSLRWQMGNDIDYEYYSPTGFLVKIATNDDGVDGTDLSSYSSSIFAAFNGGGGIWTFDGAAWTRLSPSNPENMVVSGSTLYAEFGAGGIWTWNGVSWAMLTPSNPENMVVSGSTLYAEFGAGGIWRWNETAWTMLTPSNPENMVVAGSNLYAEFGAGGIWMYNGTSWTMLTPSNPETMVAGSGSNIYAEFGTGGIWMFNGSSWTMLSPSNPESMVAAGSLLYADFGAGGIYMWNGSSWRQIANSNPESIVASGSLLYADFGAGGLYRWNGSSWTMVANANTENMVPNGTTLLADFGAGGLYSWTGTTWTMLTPSNPSVIALAN